MVGKENGVVEVSLNSESAGGLCEESVLRNVNYCILGRSTTVNYLTPELYNSAQSCLPRFFTWNFNF
jgi:hypothetical protein